MTDFERIRYYYSKGWATDAQLRQYVQYGVLTAAEYETITGQEYEASA